MKKNSKNLRWGLFFWPSRCLPIEETIRLPGSPHCTLTIEYKKAGYATVEEMLKAYGFEIISGDEVRKLRSFVLYTPGNEPDVVKNKVNSMVSRLNEYYPDKVIPRGLQNDHKNLSKAVSGLYQWLGYENASEMLKAYGFDVQYGDGSSGRPTNDYQALIDTLIERYEGVEKVKAIGLLMHDNPDLAGQIKTLQNQSNLLFGMSLAKYFKEIGILGASATESAPAKLERKKAYHYLIVDVEGVDEPVFCATDMSVFRNLSLERATSTFSELQEILWWTPVLKIRIW